MTTVDLTALYPVDDDDLTRLHTRLASGAERDGLLDVAYRTVDSPVGSLLIAATPVGLVRVAFSSEGHDVVLQNLSERISSRVLHAPKRLDAAARQLEEYFSGHRRSFDVPLDWQLSKGFRRTVLSAFGGRHRLWHHRELRDFGATFRFAEGRSRSRNDLRDKSHPCRGAVPSGRPRRRQLGRIPRRSGRQTHLAGSGRCQVTWSGDRKLS